MKQSILIICVLALFFSGIASNAETVSLGAQYVNRVYYSLANGIITEAANDNWDIGFSNGTLASNLDASIIINDAAGVELYTNPAITVNEWDNPIDTTGFKQSWQRLYNSDSTWVLGAFNMGEDGFSNGTGNYGWGVFDMGSFSVVGYTLYLIKLSNGDYKKMYIDLLSGGVYTFIFADLDGSNQMERIYNKKEYPTKNFVCYSMVNDEFVNNEPDSFNWDLLFTKYSIPNNVDGDAGENNVIGVLHNNGVFAYKMSDVDVSNNNYPSIDLFSDKISTIGYDWKGYDLQTSTYIVEDRLIYFVNPGYDIFKIVFTGFGGMENGNIDFNSINLTTSVGENNGDMKSLFTVYPNIINSGDDINIIYRTSEDSKNVNISIYSISGQKVFEKAMNGSINLSNINLGKLDLAGGMYIVVFNVDGIVSNQKLIVQ